MVESQFVRLPIPRTFLRALILVALRFAIQIAILVGLIAGVVVLCKWISKPVVTQNDSTLSRIPTSRFASLAPWFGLFGSPICIGILFAAATQLKPVGRGVHPLAWLMLMISVLGGLLSLWGIRGAKRSGRKRILVVSVLGLALNGVIGIPLLALILLGLSGARH